jgi:ribosomal protein S18 acetylase RimI-like enzyme
VKILRATLEHLDEVAGLFDRYRQFYEQAANPDGCRAFIEARMKNLESIIFAAQAADGRLVGFTQLYHSFCSVDMTELVYLYDLYVVPEARRQGVAEALMTAARDHAARRGAGRLQLETAISNRAGQALYEKLGWELDSDFLTYHLPLQDKNGESDE